MPDDRRLSSGPQSMFEILFGRYLQVHVITDGLADVDSGQLPLLGFLAKSVREAAFPTRLIRKAGSFGFGPEIHNHDDS